VLLTAIQGWFIAAGLEAYGASSGLQAVVNPGYMFRVGAVSAWIGGTMFLLWLGEQITSRGIGNGVSPDHHGGHCCPDAAVRGNLFEGGRTGRPIFEIVCPDHASRGDGTVHLLMDERSDGF
jgi:preprotein translocase subunit SecY